MIIITIISGAENERIWKQKWQVKADSAPAPEAFVSFSNIRVYF